MVGAGGGWSTSNSAQFVSEIIPSVALGTICDAKDSIRIFRVQGNLNIILKNQFVATFMCYRLVCVF